MSTPPGLGLYLAALLGGVTPHLWPLVQHWLTTRNQRERFEYEARFPHLYERHVEVIEGLYQRLASAKRSLDPLTRQLRLAGEPSIDEEFKVASAALLESFTYFEDTRFWYPSPYCEEIERVLKAYADAQAAYGHWMLEQAGLEKFERWKKATEHIDQELPKLVREVDGLLREFLGIERRRGQRRRWQFWRN